MSTAQLPSVQILSNRGNGACSFIEIALLVVARPVVRAAAQPSVEPMNARTSDQAEAEASAKASALRSENECGAPG